MGEAEEIPLVFKLMSILALLSNYNQENCLINVGTEGAKSPVIIETARPAALIFPLTSFTRSAGECTPTCEARTCEALTCEARTCKALTCCA